MDRGTARTRFPEGRLSFHSEKLFSPRHSRGGERKASTRINPAPVQPRLGAGSHTRNLKRYGVSQINTTSLMACRFYFYLGEPERSRPNARCAIDGGIFF